LNGRNNRDLVAGRGDVGVARIADEVVISIGLVRVLEVWAVIASVADQVAVFIGL
jgi:hypothetical protein